MKGSFVVIYGKVLTHSPMTHFSVASYRFGVSTVMTRSWCWSAPGRPRQYIIMAGPRAQALATLGAAGAHLTTEPDPSGTRKKHSCIMAGKAVAAVLTLLLVSAVGTKGKEILPKALLTNC